MTTPTINLDVYELGATPAGGMQVYCSYCQDWFAGWAYFAPYPPLSEIVAVCERHDTDCPVPAEEKPGIDREIAALVALRRDTAGSFRPVGWGTQ